MDDQERKIFETENLEVTEVEAEDLDDVAGGINVVCGVPDIPDINGPVVNVIC